MRRHVLIVIVLAGFLASCGSSGSGYSSSSTPSVMPIPAGPNTVLVPSGTYLGPGPGFTPNTLTVSAGTTVTWGNNDVTAHTTTADGGQWNSNDINSGGTFSVTLNAPGTYTYHCMIHSFMKGTIVVQ